MVLIWLTSVLRFPFLFLAFPSLLPCHHRRIDHQCCISPPLFEVPYNIKSTIFPWLRSSRASDWYCRRNLRFIMYPEGGSTTAWCQGGRPPSDLQDLNFAYTIYCNTRPSMPCLCATSLQTISCFLRLTVFSPNANTLFSRASRAGAPSLLECLPRAPEPCSSNATYYIHSDGEPVQQSTRAASSNGFPGKVPGIYLNCWSL